MTDSTPYRILFVCMGNICRSPAGENVLRHLAARAGLEEVWEIDSAGTISTHTGNPPDSRMTAAARTRGIPMSGRARQIRASDLDRFDLILTMDNDNLADVKGLAARHGGMEAHRARIVPFCTYCESHGETEVPDPYYGGPEGFEKVLDLLEDGCAAMVRRFRETGL
ncbi:MAG TPA: low molecular weight protein-tyrosine-phosphatase [Verrucomicrobiales bacterium]|nr:low molecular weight protein-tyrosine-phosphatase [Verrucomicrobiales bacterium]